MSTNKWEALKTFYKSVEFNIMSAGRNEWGIHPYEWEQFTTMTQIEAWFWQDVRIADIVLYPQYPVDRFFVDFANPVAKVAVECDGRDFHVDKEKDKRRDDILSAIGWKVYRITGRDCRKDFNGKTMERSASRKLVDYLGERHKISRAGQ